MKLILYTLFVFSTVILTTRAQPMTPPTPPSLNDWKQQLEEWIPRQYKRSVQGIFDNINRPGTAKGCIVAADSKKQPDYYYNW